MKLIASDIDGVLTDGSVYINSGGYETKKISYRDLDAAAVIRKAGYLFALVTGEDSDMARIIAEKYGAEHVLYGAKDKLEALTQLAVMTELEITDMVYIGDSDRDAPAIKAAGIGIAPRDASKRAAAAADIVTDAPGGGGVLQEVAELMERGELICGKK